VDYPKLKAELTNDPLALGYSGMNDQIAANKLNATDTGRTQVRNSVSKLEIFKGIVNSEWPTTAILQNKLQTMFALDTIDPSNANIQAIITSIFAAGTATRANIIAMATQTVSRATELALGEVVSAGHVQQARSGNW
jgi:hypothetical protein